ncbi:hypothetical protein DW253_15280 [Ruminococcus sp. AM22-13]|nr:hypothetical protein DW253_15280 [Ruminococcus sp. AM22-13]
MIFVFVFFCDLKIYSVWIAFWGSEIIQNSRQTLLLCLIIRYPALFVYCSGEISVVIYPHIKKHKEMTLKQIIMRYGGNIGIVYNISVVIKI